MRVIDTNILVRFLAGDERRQFEKVKVLIAEEPVFVPLTVVLETACVLRSQYGRSDSQAAEDLADMAALANVTVEAPERLVRALAWTQAGMDFADALHLSAAKDHDGFITFDRSLAKIAAREGVRDIELL